MSYQLTVTKRFDLCIAHNLCGHNGKCKFIHGHNYKMDVTVISKYLAKVNTHSQDRLGSSYGMIVDFKDLKNIINSIIVDKYDHSFIVWANATKLTSIPEIDNAIKNMKNADTLKDYNIHLVDYRPTAENMCIKFAEEINEVLEDQHKMYKLKRLRIYETDDSYAEWEAI